MAICGFEGYADSSVDSKGRTQAAQMRAALCLSREVAWLYRQIEAELSQRSRDDLAHPG